MRYCSGRFFRGLLRQRMAARSLVSLFFFVGATVGASAEPSRLSLTIDDGRPTFVSFEANNVPLTQILKQISEALHIEIKYAMPVDKSAVITGSFRGDVNDILRRVLLPNGGYVIWYNGSAIDRILVTSSGARASVAAAGSSPGPAEPPQDLVELPAATLPPPAGGTQQNGNSLSNLLQAQANVMQQSIADMEPIDGSDTLVSGALSTRQNPQLNSASVGAEQTSLAAMTHTAQANVRMLAKALTAVCNEASCVQ